MLSSKISTAGGIFLQYSIPCLCSFSLLLSLPLKRRWFSFLGGEGVSAGVGFCNSSDIIVVVIAVRLSIFILAFHLKRVAREYGSMTI